MFSIFNTHPPYFQNLLEDLSKGYKKFPCAKVVHTKDVSFVGMCFPPSGHLCNTLGSISIAFENILSFLLFKDDKNIISLLFLLN